MILTRPRFRREFRRLDQDDQERVRAALRQLPAVFGRPHLHHGLGIRPFGPYYELRVGLDLRVLFLPDQGDLVLVAVGTHDTVRRFLRNG